MTATDERTKQVVITVNYEGKQFVFHTFPYEYRSLMHLLADKLFIEGFGECSGMGKCGTCIIGVVSSKFRLTDFDRNEQKTMDRVEGSGDNLRLSCQIVADEFLEGLEIHLIEQN
ncbi:MAG: 2Fe-2S iron-sulfur cluster-binding protein [Pedobacter sp.]|uniref:2Fe-2S iron-sulfur cluster-binding protein n=1 Tax=Pedobacter sp. TaxID=1411316 RepID=UPI0033929302